VTLDAMDWVWQHARARGNPRLVLLAVANACTGPDATAPMGAAELRQRLGGVSKDTVTAAVARALESGELEITEPARGSRAALYRLPGAVGHTSSSALDPGAQTAATAPGFRAQRDLETASALKSGAQRDLEPTAPELCPEIQGTTRSLCAPKSRAQTSDLTTTEDRATRAQASFKSILIERESEGARAPEPGLTAGGIPPFARPLVDAITAAGVIVRWDLAPGEWFTVDAMVKRSGAEMLAAVAVQATQRARNGVSHARYFLRAWQALPPTPTPGTTPATPGSNVVPFAARRGPADSQQQTDDMFDRAMQRAQARMTNPQEGTSW
jgi:hypothetical protein